MTGRWIHSVLILFILTAKLQAEDRTSERTQILKKLEDISNLKSPAVAADYDGANIEQFVPQFASDLKLYGLKGVSVQQWNLREGLTRVTLFEMSDAPAAYGAYTLQRSKLGGEPTPALIGAASFQHAGGLYFWQSKYAVHIEGPASLRDQVAQVVSRNILGRSEKPPVSGYLPSENIVEGSEEYILRPERLASWAGLDPQALGFDWSAEAARASYRVRGNSVQLVLLLYPTQHIARKFADALQVSAGTFVKRSGPLVAIVHGAPNESIAATILDDVGHGFKVTWDQPPPGLGLGTMLITIFTFIGIALAFTVAVGISYGGLRVFVKSRYPNKIFDRPETVEIIQLKLLQGVTDRQIGDGSGARGA